MHNADGYLPQAIIADLMSIGSIAGTLSESDCQKPEGLKREISRSVLMTEICQSDLVVIDLHSSDLQEVEFILTQLGELKSEEPQITIVLISTVLVWSRTPQTKQQPGNSESPENEESAEKDETIEDAEKPLSTKRIFSSADFSLRTPPPALRTWKFLETLALSLNRPGHRVRSFVVGAGCMYGLGEWGWFREAFQKAYWGDRKGVEEISRFPEGYLPVIHVRDVARMVKLLIGEGSSKSRYFLAVEATEHTQGALVEAILKVTGFEENLEISSEKKSAASETPQQSHQPNMDVLLSPVWTSSVDLRFSGSEIFARPEFISHCPGGFVKNIEKIFREFAVARKLQPLRVCVGGIPLSGKSSLARELGQVLGLPVISLGLIVKSALEKAGDLKKKRDEEEKARKGNKGKEVQLSETKPDDEKPENDKFDGEPPVDGPDSVEEALAAPSDEEKFLLLLWDEAKQGRLSPATVSRLLRDEILRKPSTRSRGWVLDGYPRNRLEAETFFLDMILPEIVSADSPDDLKEVDEKKEEISRSASAPPNQFIPTHLQPACVFLLECAEKKLGERNSAMAISAGKGSHYSASDLSRRLQRYRVDNGLETSDSPGNSVSRFCGDWKIPLIAFECGDTVAGSVSLALNILEKLGIEVESLRRRGRVSDDPEAREEREKLRAENLKKDLEIKEKLEKEFQETIEKETLRLEKENKLKEGHLEKIKELENFEKRELEKRSEHLKEYLEREVMPVLREGIFEITKCLPEDPVKHLAEFLFKAAYSKEN